MGVNFYRPFSGCFPWLYISAAYKFSVHLTNSRRAICPGYSWPWRCVRQCLIRFYVQLAALSSAGRWQCLLEGWCFLCLSREVLPEAIWKGHSVSPLERQVTDVRECCSLINCPEGAGGPENTVPLVSHPLPVHPT